MKKEKVNEVKPETTVYTDGEVYLIYLISNLISEVGVHARKTQDSVMYRNIQEILNHYDEKLDSFIFSLNGEEAKDNMYDERRRDE